VWLFLVLLLLLRLLVAAADVANEPHDPGLKGSILSVAVVAGCSLLPKGELSTPKFGRRQKCIKIMYF